MFFNRLAVPRPCSIDMHKELSLKIATFLKDCDHTTYTSDLNTSYKYE